MDEAVETLQRAVVDPLCADDRPARTHGVFVHGPSGSGKSFVLQALAGELATAGFSVARLGSLMAGDVQTVVADLGTVLREQVPCVLLADPFYNASHPELAEAVKALLRELNASGERVLIAATDGNSRLNDGLCPLFEAFEVKVAVHTPDRDRREALFAAFLDELTTTEAVAFDSDAVNLAAVANRAEDFSAIQIRTACKQAIHLTLSGEDASISQSKLLNAVAEVSEETEEASEQDRFGDFQVESIESTDITFDDIGGLDEQKRLLQEYFSPIQEYILIQVTSVDEQICEHLSQFTQRPARFSNCSIRECQTCS